MSVPSFINLRSLWRSEGLLSKQWRDILNGDEDDMDRVPATPGMANLVSSLVALPADDGISLHMPVLDIDFEAHLEPSSTPGHYHLYLNRVMTWDTYSKLLKALYDAGIIEEGVYEMSIARGQTFVRYPGVKKQPGEAGSA